jgi:hypothetical protein
MKKLLQILPFILFALSVNAQQTEDDIYVGKGKTFGNYKETDTRTTKPINGQLTITGTVVKVDWCEDDCLTIWVKKDDGTTIAVGTKDFGFTVPKNITGNSIIIEGIVPAKLILEKKERQKDIQIAATGVRIFRRKR